MSVIIAHTYIGGQDLYNGIPNLQDAKVVDVIPEKCVDNYTTTLVLRNVRGQEHRIIIKQSA